MKPRTRLALLALILAVPAASGEMRPAAPAPLIVDSKGAGTFRTIQAALESLPDDAPTTRVILIRAGLYAEKVYVTKRHVALVGEDRKKTRIVFAELRKNWRKDHSDDWGAAVINIGDTVTDLVIANLTVHNNYGSLHGDHDHQFAIRSGGASTRLSLLSVDVIADGGDTLSLWNTATGMYYLADSYFEGHVDYVCPRGWCYATDSRFFGRNTSASIWHDGNLYEDSKFVIRNSSFDGIPGFALGRNTRDGQFLLLDCFFSKNMADKPIYQAPGTATFQWPVRAYFWNARREGGPLAWIADSLGLAKGSPREEDIDARWTFGGRWDPEETMPAVLPGAAIPRPRQNARVALTGLTLRWLAARAAASYEVYLGETGTVPLRVATVTSPSFKPGALKPSTNYQWRVDTLPPSGVRVTGPAWSFTTK
ncbi:MAG TPA: pectinesterase family protein [Vicinamibacteria bacterium]|nr:pectinesterase family protein [Vicinamibacteria bacterium]